MSPRKSDAAVALQQEQDDGLPGVERHETFEVSDEKREAGLDYVSKSRIKTYLNCPRKLWYKYWTETRPPSSYHLEKGSDLHEVFEDFHLNVLDFIDEHGRMPDHWAPHLPVDYKLWSQWLEPHLKNFWQFEQARWELAQEVTGGNHAVGLWSPVEVEAEFWLGEPPQSWLDDGNEPDYVTPYGPPVGGIPWQGKADAILHTQTVPDVEGTGVVFVDYKTGKVPKEQYQEKGIFLETEYYAWLAEECEQFDHEIDAVVGYYPQEDEMLVGDYPTTWRRNLIEDAVLGMQEPPELSNYPRDEGPLCHYGHGKCHFYDHCQPDWEPR